MKDKVIGGVIGTASGLIVGIVLFFFGGIKTEAQAFKELVDGKVDRTEFIEFKEVNEKEHIKLNNDRKEDNLKLEKHIDKRFEDFKDFMIELNKK